MKIHLTTENIADCSFAIMFTSAGILMLSIAHAILFKM